MGDFFLTSGGQPYIRLAGTNPGPTHLRGGGSAKGQTKTVGKPHDLAYLPTKDPPLWVGKMLHLSARLDACFGAHPRMAQTRAHNVTCAIIYFALEKGGRGVLYWRERFFVCVCCPLSSESFACYGFIGCQLFEAFFSQNSMTVFANLPQDIFQGEVPRRPLFQDLTPPNAGPAIRRGGAPPGGGRRLGSFLRSMTRGVDGGGVGGWILGLMGPAEIFSKCFQFF